MPTYIYADHGDLAPYLAMYPGLFGLYDATTVVTSKPYPKRGSGGRDKGFIWQSSRSRFSTPSTQSPSTQSSSPYLYTFYDDSSSISSPPEQVSAPKRRPPPRAEPVRSSRHESSRSKRDSQNLRAKEIEIRYEPAQSLRRTKAIPALPRATPVTISPSSPASYTSSPCSVQRRNAVRRDSKLRPPLTQTDPAVALPSLVRLDRLLDTLSSLTAAASTAVPTSNSSPRPLPRDLQSQLTALQPYISTTEHDLLPDQDSAAARHSSGTRIFPHIRVTHDPFSARDPLRMHPTHGPTDAVGAARWRALQRITREPHTAARRELVPSVIAALTAQVVVRHALRLVDWRGRDFGNPRVKAEQQPAYKELHSYRDAKPRRRAQTAPSLTFGVGGKPRIITSRWAEDSDAGVELGMPTPLALRVRRLERMDLRLQRVLVGYGRAIWGRRADVSAWLGWAREVLIFEGFLK